MTYLPYSMHIIQPNTIFNNNLIKIHSGSRNTSSVTETLVDLDQKFPKVVLH